MSIRIRSTSLQAAGEGGGVPADGYLDKIVKSIPSQVIAFYTAALVWLQSPGTQAASPGNAQASAAGASAPASASNPKLWIAFALGVVLSAFLTYRQTHEANKPPAYRQIIIATVSFVIWAFATGGPFQTLSFWSAGVATLVLAAYTLALGAIPAE
ncbi:MAG: hypothetical protein ACXWID_00105 [Pyrinomonadaceae bacterium]